MPQDVHDESQWRIQDFPEVQFSAKSWQNSVGINFQWLQITIYRKN